MAKELAKLKRVPPAVKRTRQHSHKELEKETGQSGGDLAQAIVETVREPLLVLSGELRIKAANRSFYQTFRVSPEETEDRLIYEVGNHQWDIPKLRELLEEILPEHGQVDEFEVEHDFQSIGHKTMLINARRLRQREPATELILLAIEDITERKQVEDGLHSAFSYNRSLIEASLDSLVTISEAGKITDVNKATEAATGFSRDQLVGTDFSHYFTEPKKARAGYKRVLREGLVTDYPLTIRHVSGKETHVLYNATVYRNEQGQVQGVFAAARDVTETKKMEDEVRSAFSYTRGLIEASLDPLVTISEAGKITDVNKATEAATGFSRDQLVGKDFSDYFTEPKKARAGYKRVLREGLVRDYPLTIRHVSGKETDVLYNATVYRDQRGQVQGVFAAARDITETKKLEDALMQKAEDLARSNAELEQFAYVASHDLQEPLRMVASYTQLLGKRYKGKLDGDADEFISFAVEGANRMQRLIKDLLIYSRAGARDQEPEPTYSEHALDEALASLQVAITESAAQVTHDPLPKVLADGAQLGQVFQNLIGNALKYRGDAPPRIHISAAQEGDMWLFSVRDNGIGIDPEYHERVFVIFQRLHPREEQSGTGIGLAVCKKIVERHGGRIWLESEPGKGATFYFTVPAMAGIQLAA